MRITALVENRGSDEVKGVHGLSLYIETSRHRLLFDLGPDDTLFCNAAQLGIDLAGIDTVILSHGHSDHGGALRKFLNINHLAKVYVQKAAFEPHFCKVLCFRVPVALDTSLAGHPQIVLLEGDTVLDEELSLFVVKDATRCWSPANARLHDRLGPDRFLHEQNLFIRDGGKALIMGCGHTGVLNILAHAPEVPDLCIGGYHLDAPLSRHAVTPALLDDIASGLCQYPRTAFHTCHCTGERAFRHLSQRVKEMHYLGCGNSVSL